MKITCATCESATKNASGSFDPGVLDGALEAIRDAGMPGVYAEVRDHDRVWRGARGVADIETGRPAEPDLRQRVGSITKTFVAAAVLRQIERGRIGLDSPIGDYLPRLVPGERGTRVTVRMLLNHTSGIPDYLPFAFPSLRGFPSLREVSPESLDDHRFTAFDSAELIRLGLNAPANGGPGETPGRYSNTNYLILGQLLEHVTGATAEECVTTDVIERAGLDSTGFPDGPRIEGPHARMYESFFGLIDPPRDYSVYTPTWVPTGAGLVSTVADLNDFHQRLVGGAILDRATLAHMQSTVPVVALDGEAVDYGLGLHRVTAPGGDTYWGADGTVWGALTVSLVRSDGLRSLSIAMNLVRWNELDSTRTPRPHPIDDALSAFCQKATCGHGRAVSSTRMRR